MAKSKESLGLMAGLLLAMTAAWAGPSPSYAPPAAPGSTPAAAAAAKVAKLPTAVSALPALRSAVLSPVKTVVPRVKTVAPTLAVTEATPHEAPAAVAKPARQHKSARKEEKRPPVQTAPRRVIRIPLPKNAYRVSTRDYNVFAFPEPLRRAVLPPGAPLAGKPLYMSHDQVLLLRFYPDNYRPVQMVAELRSGAVVTLSLVPDPDVAGVRIHVQVNGARLPRQRKHSADPNSRFVPELARIVAGGKLSGYTPAPLPPERIYDRLVAKPVASSTAGETVITQYELTARHGKRSVVDPGQFSWPGVRAALLTGSVVDAHDSPFLYVVTRQHEAR